MSQIDPQYLLSLLEVSELFSDNQKQAIKAKLPSLSGVKVVELFDILEKEAVSKNKMLKRVLSAKKTFAHQKAKALYDYAERKIEEEEEVELASLDKELNSLPD